MSDGAVERGDAHHEVQPWTADRAGDLLGLVQAAMPDERLGVDDLLACCFEDDGVVLGTPGGEGAVGVVVRRFDGLVVAHVQLVAVHPDARRRGRGRALLAAAERWARQAGAQHLLLGGAAPWYLWPGVDAASTEALCLAEACGYRSTGSELNMVLSTDTWLDPPPDVRIERVLSDEAAARLEAFVAARWPMWVPEALRAVEHGTCFAALDGDDVVGFVGHSVNRAGWLGPMGTDAARQGGGVGGALVAAVCRDLRVAGHSSVEIAWVGPVRFYAKLGARVSRVFRTYLRSLG